MIGILPQLAFEFGRVCGVQEAHGPVEYSLRAIIRRICWGRRMLVAELGQELGVVLIRDRWIQETRAMQQGGLNAGPLFAGALNEGCGANVDLHG